MRIEISAKKEGQIWQQRRKQRKRRGNEQILGFLLSPGPLPQAGLFLVASPLTTQTFQI
jgi:hypothetical protein